MEFRSRNRYKKTRPASSISTAISADLRVVWNRWICILGFSYQNSANLEGLLNLSKKTCFKKLINHFDIGLVGGTFYRIGKNSCILKPTPQYQGLAIFFKGFAPKQFQTKDSCCFEIQRFKAPNNPKQLILFGLPGFSMGLPCNSRGGNVDEPKNSHREARSVSPKYRLMALLGFGVL